MSDGTAAGLDPRHLALLQALMRGELQGGAALAELVANAGLNEEQLSLLKLLMEQGAADDEEPVDVDAVEVPFERWAEPGAAVGDELRDELADLREANDTLASALGACARCWGGERGCPVCHGRGRPGFALPDRELFRELVVPAVRRVFESTREVRRARMGRAGRATHDPRR